MISIIIPVYNSDKYLSRCLDSIEAQTYRDFNIVIVNDASTDNSLEVCNEYSKKYPNIKIINLEKNGGQAAAYTKGIVECEGDLVSFVDSDDWIAPNMLEELINSMNKYHSDISACGTVHVYPDKETVEPSNIESVGEKLFSKEDIHRDLYELHTLSNSIDKIVKLYRCNKLFNKSLLHRNLKYIDTSIRVFEDNDIVIPCIADANCISYVNKPLYYYRRRTGSTMSLFDENILSSNRRFLELQKRIYAEKGISHSMQSDAYVATAYSIARILSSNNSIKSKVNMLQYVGEDISKYSVDPSNISRFSASRKFGYIYGLVCKGQYYKAIALGKLHSIYKTKG